MASSRRVLSSGFRVCDKHYYYYYYDSCSYSCSYCPSYHDGSCDCRLSLYSLYSYSFSYVAALLISTISTPLRVPTVSELLSMNDDDEIDIPTVKVHPYHDGISSGIKGVCIRSILVIKVYYYRFHLN